VEATQTVMNQGHNNRWATTTVNFKGSTTEKEKERKQRRK